MCNGSWLSTLWQNIHRFCWCRTPVAPAATKLSDVERNFAHGENKKSTLTEIEKIETNHPTISPPVANGKGSTFNKIYPECEQHGDRHFCRIDYTLLLGRLEILTCQRTVLISSDSNNKFSLEMY